MSLSHLAVAVSWLSASAAQDQGAPPVSLDTGTVAYSPLPDRVFPGGVILGDTHLHTSYSTDAEIKGNKGNKPHSQYQCFAIVDTSIPGKIEVPTGMVTIQVPFEPDGSKEGGGTHRLRVNCEPAGKGKLTSTLFRHGLGPFEIGRDSITPIAPAYRDSGEFEFSGGPDKVTFELSKR